MTDIRNTDPNATAHRKARFITGWHHATDGRTYNDDALKHTTWQNLGWRLGLVLGLTPDDLIVEMYDWCVRQQVETGMPIDDLIE